MSATTQPARRGFLAMLTVAAATAPAIALSAIAEPAAPAVPVITEAPELLALGTRLDAAIEILTAAAAAKAEARAMYERTKPPVPDALIAGRADRMAQLSDPLLDIDYDPVRGEAGEPLQILCSRRIRAHLILKQIDGRSKEGRRLHRAARLAVQHEKAVTAALRVSNYDVRELEAGLAGNAVLKIAREMAKLDASTASGAAIFARLVMVFDEASGSTGCYSGGGLADAIGRRLAGALLRINGGGAS